MFNLNKDEVISDYQKGLTIQEIAEKSKADYFSIYRIVSLLPEHEENATRARVFLEERKNEIKRMRDNGETFSNIALKFGISKQRAERIYHAEERKKM